MRLFVAIPLPAEVKDALVAQQTALRHEFPHERSVRWVSVESMHLTLQFLGEVEPARSKFIVAALNQIVAHYPTPIALNLDRASAFPNLRHPQTLWCGVSGDIAALRVLQHALSAALQPLGFLPDQRPFGPHLTLGRVRRETTPDQQTAIGNAVRALVAPEPTPGIAEPPVLFESTLTPAGAMYSRIT